MPGSPSSIVCLTDTSTPSVAIGARVRRSTDDSTRCGRELTTVRATVRNGTCIGCGTCGAACASRAISFVWTRNSEHQPSIDDDACTSCGRCLEVCPLSPEAVSADAHRVCLAPVPTRVGLEGTTCYLAWDNDGRGRRRSASGGVVTGLLRLLLETGRAEVVLHAEPVDGPAGQPHVRAVLSRTVQELDARRSSFYHPVCNADSLTALLGAVKSVAIVGTPCVLRGITALWRLDPRFRLISLTTVGLACSHNVNGQFMDFLATSLGIPPGTSFSADLRNKIDIPDANNYNTSLSVGGREVVRINRFRSLHTHIWRQHWFAMGACHTCADFWGHSADVVVKDAWGSWAKDPLGKSIVVVRDPGVRALLEGDDRLHLEPLPVDVVAGSQEQTAIYKQVQALDRLELRVWSRPNRRSSYLRYKAASVWSKMLWRTVGYAGTRAVMFLLFGRPVLRPPHVDPRTDAAVQPVLRRFAKRLQSAVAGLEHHRVVCWGTGAMAVEVDRVLLGRVAYFVDGDPTRQAGEFHGRPVRDPAVLKQEHDDRLVIVIASIHDEAIRERIEALRLTVTPRIVSVAPIRREARTSPWYRRRPPTRRAEKKPAQPTPARPDKRQRQILVVGGYGYQNAGDEAQLSTTLAELQARFPAHVVKVLTPNPSRTHLLHGRCAVGEAPRLAFYDSDTSRVYELRTRRQKLAFLARSWWLLLHATLVRQGLPVAIVGARRLSLLHDLATSDLLVFSGGGYLTGKTLSRVWDGLFLMLLARRLGTPCVLSGQTIGLWNSRFTKQLARRAFETATVIATRDGDGSRIALQGLHLMSPRIMTTCDDALLMPREDWESIAQSALAASGFDAEMAHTPYVVLNAHYWGITDRRDRAALVERLAWCLDRLREAGVPGVVGLPMVPDDSTTLLDLEQARPGGWFRPLRYDGHFRVARAVVARSRVCITMKHHPVIFALGEGVPAISLSRGTYYEQKNIGALGLVGLEHCNVPIDDDGFEARFQATYARIDAEHADIVRRVRACLPSLAERRELFFRMVERVVPTAGPRR